MRQLKKVIPKSRKVWLDVRRKSRTKNARRRVFVDCGSNTCTVLRQFVHKFPDWEFFAFEPQPELGEHAGRLQDEFPGLRLSFFNTAVWTKNETLNFFLATQWGPNHRGGSTLVSGHTNNGSEVDYAQPIQVEAIDFSQWMQANFTCEDYVIVKMDIEGAEYTVLEKMVADNSIQLVKELIVEFHQHMNTSISKERHDKLLASLRKSTAVVPWY